MAGPSSVSPMLEEAVKLGAVEGEESDEEVEGEFAGEACERVGLPKEDECLRRIRDPKLPSKGEVEAHWLMAHMPFRDWCKWCLWGRGMVEARERSDPDAAPTSQVISMGDCFSESGRRDGRGCDLGYG